MLRNPHPVRKTGQKDLGDGDIRRVDGILNALKDGRLKVPDARAQVLRWAREAAAWLSRGRVAG